jgi:hypothetical protein
MTNDLPQQQPDDDLSTEAAAREIVSTNTQRFRFFRFRRKDNGEIIKDEKESEIVLSAFGQAEWAAVDSAAVEHYLEEQAETQKRALREFGEFLTQEQINERINKYIDDRNTINVDVLPMKKILRPVLKNKKPVIKDMIPVTTESSIPYVGWFAGNTEAGQLEVVYQSARRSDSSITMSKIEEMFENNPEGDLERAASIVLMLSRSRLGERSTGKNSESKEDVQKRRKQRRAERQRKKQQRR